LYPPGPDAYCAACRRPLDAQDRIAAALAELVRTRPAESPPASQSPTCGVEQAARILNTTVNGIYAMHARGKLPATVGFGRKLLWRRDDLLMSPARRASSLEKGIRR
jgi:hypothetical protein